jgi:hypothetical protein
MVRSTVKQIFVLALAFTAAGCGGDDSPKLAETVGQVSYKGSPLKDANVVFMPASGPPAYATTDANGAFVLSTQGDPGAMVGSGTFVITAFEGLPEKKPEHLLTAADLKKMNTSLIPAKYGKPDSSGLKETIKPGVKNEFKFDLQ